MVSNLFFLALSFILFAAAKTNANPTKTHMSPVYTRDTLALSEHLGISAPNFTDEAAIWRTSFQKQDATGLNYTVQLPRVYTAGHYDAASSEQYFLDFFSDSQERWKEGAVIVLDEPHIERRWAAFLQLKYCSEGGGRGTCTGFSLNYDSNGCQAAPHTNSIVITYSQNSAVVAWNKGGCSGRYTLFANGCNGGAENVIDETPGTNSFQFIVGCTF